MLAALLALCLLSACSTTSTTSDVFANVAPPPPLASEKYAAIVVDAGSGRALYKANDTAIRYPASLTKMMTLYLLFEALQSGRVTLATEMPVSAHSASQAPTKLGLKPGQTINVEAAIMALAVKSANDVAATVAEFLGGGSEEQFAAMMTAKARQIGMSNTVFRNASGLPIEGQYTTARDMAVLGISLRKRFPQYYGRFSARSFDFRGRTIAGHNRLLGRVEGVDGIKTGYIRASGYNIVTSVGRKGKRLVIVVMGGKSGRERDAHVEELIERYLPLPRGPGYVPPVTGPALAPPPETEADLPGVGSAAPPEPVQPPASSAALPPPSAPTQLLPKPGGMDADLFDTAG